jgi:hypothetical protein
LWGEVIFILEDNVQPQMQEYREKGDKNTGDQITRVCVYIHICMYVCVHMYIHISNSYITCN